MKNIIYIFSIMCILSGCVTRGIWEPDNKTGYEMDYGNAKNVDVKYNLSVNNDKIVCTYKTLDGVVSLTGTRPISLSNFPTVSQITQWNSQIDGVKWSVAFGEEDNYKSLEYLRPLINADVSQELKYSCKYTCINEVYVGKYKVEKVVGRIVMTPFAVAADVVIVATAVIWYPVVASMLNDLRKIN